MDDDLQEWGLQDGRNQKRIWLFSLMRVTQDLQVKKRRSQHLGAAEKGRRVLT